MVESLRSYFDAFKNFGAHGERQVSYLELLGISWALHILYTFYSLITLYMGVRSYDYLSSSQDFGHLVLESFNFKFQKFSLFSSLFAVILYPLVFHFSYRAWIKLFQFYAGLFEKEGVDHHEKERDILNSAYSSNLLLVFPIIGNFLSNLGFLFFIFQGLRSRYNFSPLQAFLVLLTPFFLLFLIAIFSASYFVFLFTLL